MIFTAADATALGGRETNQDACHSGDRLLAVADGVGGAPAGDVAAGLAIQTAVERPGDTPESIVSAANAAVRARGDADPNTTGMGTTFDVVVIARSGGRWVVRGAHVGDSVTLVHTDGIRVLTKSHTLANELIAAGHLTEEEGERHPQKSALVRAVGLEPTIRPDLWELPAHRGDRYILCSDGLTNTLGDGLWPLLVALRGETPAVCANELVRAACQAGPRDNVTAVVGDVRGGAGWLN
ncbi:PP2C family protein-serine/threonine phosphatase [Actinokineospora inagensis]|uniref:PP2C family protein-serine/threonine phosphatase n=1 Tax=Actinokineospora inagensis TaxID=103730 RepID=UPI00042184BC|nr:protein phosphatase 2C domain-containing protein [Actinokineospora inagensis]